jgi:hypothetical protein
MSPSAVRRLRGRAPGVGSGAAPGVSVAEVEAVGPGLGDEQMEEFKAGHKWVDSCAEATYRRGCMDPRERLKANLDYPARLRIRRFGCIILVHSSGRSAVLGSGTSCSSECGGSHLGRSTSPGPRFSGDCQLWLLNARSVMNPTSGGRATDCSTFFCAASAWCPCAATYANIASSGSARACGPESLPLRVSFLLRALRVGAASAGVV